VDHVDTGNCINSHSQENHPQVWQLEVGAHWACHPYLLRSGPWPPHPRDGVGVGFLEGRTRRLIAAMPLIPHCSSGCNHATSPPPMEVPTVVREVIFHLIHRGLSPTSPTRFLWLLIGVISWPPPPPLPHKAMSGWRLGPVYLHVIWVPGTSLVSLLGRPKCFNFLGRWLFR